MGRYDDYDDNLDDVESYEFEDDPDVEEYEDEETGDTVSRIPTVGGVTTYRTGTDDSGKIVQRQGEHEGQVRSLKPSDDSDDDGDEELSNIFNSLDENYNRRIKDEDCDHQRDNFGYCKKCDNYRTVENAGSSAACSHGTVNKLPNTNGKYGQCANKNCLQVIDIEKHKAKGLETLG